METKVKNKVKELNNDHFFVDLENLMYCTVSGNYTHMYFSNDRPQTVLQSLSDLERLLPKNSFFRNYKNSLVNINYIKEVPLSEKKFLIMEDGKKLNLSKKKKRDFIEMIRKKYIFLC